VTENTLKTLPFCKSWLNIHLSTASQCLETQMGGKVARLQPSDLSSCARLFPAFIPWEEQQVGMRCALRGLEKARSPQPQGSCWGRRHRETSTVLLCRSLFPQAGVDVFQLFYLCTNSGVLCTQYCLIVNNRQENVMP